MTSGANGAPIEEHWLPRPERTWDGETEAALEERYRRALAAGGGWLEPDLPVEPWAFLCWLADRKGLLLHGSPDPAIGCFEPREPDDRSVDAFSGRAAVFAAGDGIWAIFYAVLDRSLPNLRFLNGALQFELDRGRLSRMHYFFSVSAEALRQGPWRDGVVYLLPRRGFERQPPYLLGGRRVLEPHWASPEAVRPLAKLRVGPGDFPFLDRVRGHDPDRVAERSRRDPYGFPWLDRDRRPSRGPHRG